MADMMEKIKFVFRVSVFLSCLWCLDTDGNLVAVGEGQKATLDCLLTLDNRTRTVSWYKQRRGDSPQFILSYTLKNVSRLSYGYGIDSSRFTVQTKEDNAQQQQLQISATTRNDTAVYYCLLSSSNIQEIKTNYTMSG